MSEIKIDIATLKQNSKDFASAIKTFNTTEKKFKKSTNNVMDKFKSDFTSSVHNTLRTINNNSLQSSLDNYRTLLDKAIQNYEKMDTQLSNKYKSKGKGK